MLRDCTDASRAEQKRMNPIIQNPDSELQQIQIGLFPNSGGLPIIVNDQLIGAIGVGGGAGTTGGDENCAIEGLKAAFGNRVLLPVYPEQKPN